MDAINSGKLIRLGQTRIQNPCGYRLVKNPAMPESPAMLAFTQWLQSQTDIIEQFEQDALR